MTGAYVRLAATAIFPSSCQDVAAAPPCEDTLSSIIPKLWCFSAIKPLRPAAASRLSPQNRTWSFI